jgi:hypothetical protein
MAELHDTDWVCIDFDGVLAESIWPEPGIGDAINEGFKAALEYERQGKQIIVYTSRHWSDYEDIVDWLFLRGCTWPVVCGKVLASVYLDDRAVRFER